MSGAWSPCETSERAAKGRMEKTGACVWEENQENCVDFSYFRLHMQVTYEERELSSSTNGAGSLQGDIIVASTRSDGD